MTESAALKTIAASLGEIAAQLRDLLPQEAMPSVAASAAAVAWRYERRIGFGGAPTARFVPIARLSAIRFEDLLGIEAQKARLIANTRQFLAGAPANNVLLSGARGTGKSSLVKACLNAFAAEGLRLLEVGREDLADLPLILDALSQAAQSAPKLRFILYVDDLSFSEGERGYRALKSALEGTLAEAAALTRIYATSNRRHLLPEHFRDNSEQQSGPDDEIHPGEALEEKISLSERFGLWLPFYPFSPDEYLAMVRHWLGVLRSGAAAKGGTAAQSDDWERAALNWATQRGSRSGRVAWQFAADWAGREWLTP